MAIICSSIPAFSAIFRHHCGKSHVFSSILRRLRVWSRCRKTKSHSWSLRQITISDENAKQGMGRNEPGLQEVPSGGMSRIRTFIRKNHRSIGESTEKEVTLEEEHALLPDNWAGLNDGMDIVSNQVNLSVAPHKYSALSWNLCHHRTKSARTNWILSEAPPKLHVKITGRDPNSHPSSSHHL